MDEICELIEEIEKNLAEKADTDLIHDTIRKLKRSEELSAELGMVKLNSCASALRRFIQEQGDANPEAFQVAQFCVASLKEEILKGNKDVTDNLVTEVFTLLGMDKAEESDRADESIIDDIIESSSPAEAVDLSRLREILERGGAELVEPEEGSPYFAIRFPLRESEVKRLERIFGMSDPGENMNGEFSDPAMKELFLTLKEFMIAFSQGDLELAGETLNRLSRNQGQHELYNELGSIARKLHEALKNLGAALDPQIKEFVEDKLPDSGHRLEHILKITENAANITLDRLENLQSRRSSVDKVIKELEEAILFLYPLGEKAESQLEGIRMRIEKIKDLLGEDREDFTQILTAQDFQDLTGQIIMKVMNLLTELEQKLVELVETFGIRIKGRSKKEKDRTDELYGPAHEKKEGALRSQDEVDALLAEFGF
ncbi:protein phosphatase CheZ [Thermodesulforhabdus norvegica]|nr:protein phosphatase CheZ [Thermodesulforhabdus norvegica]